MFTIKFYLVIAKICKIYVDILYSLTFYTFSCSCSSSQPPPRFPFLFILVLPLLPHSSPFSPLSPPPCPFWKTSLVLLTIKCRVYRHATSFLFLLRNIILLFYQQKILIQRSIRILWRKCQVSVYILINTSLKWSG